MSTEGRGPLPRTRATDAFERRVQRALARMAPRDTPVVVACSGGADSSATLVAVVRGGWPVHAASFDHGLRPRDETVADRAAVQQLAERLDVPLLVGGTRRRGGVASEAHARGARYRWLARACVEAGVEHCVTGHTLDDQAETVLLRLARGSGVGGVSGMAALAPWPVPRARRAAHLSVVRPLLDVTRAEVERYLSTLNIEARHDSSNVQLRYGRNRIRRRVLPELERVHRGATRSLARFATLARRDNEVLEGFADTELAQIVSMKRGAVELQRRELAALPMAVVSRVLRQAAGRIGIDLDARQLESLAQVVHRRGARVDLDGGHGETDDTVLRLERGPPLR